MDVHPNDLKDPKDLKQLYQSYRTELYAGCPQVLRFEERKRYWLLVLLVLCFAVNIASGLFLARGGTQLSTVLLLAGIIIRLAPDLIFLLATMGTRWQMALTLYLIPFSHLFNLLRLIPSNTTLDMLPWILVELLKTYPLLSILSVIQLLYLILVLITAVVLTIPARNRALSICSHNLNQKMLEFVTQHHKQARTEKR